MTVYYWDGRIWKNKYKIKAQNEVKTIDKIPPFVRKLRAQSGTNNAILVYSPEREITMEEINAQIRQLELPIYDSFWEKEIQPLYNHLLLLYDEIYSLY